LDWECSFNSNAGNGSNHQTLFNAPQEIRQKAYFCQLDAPVIPTHSYMGTFSWIVLAILFIYLVVTTSRRFRQLKNYKPESESDKLILLNDEKFNESVASGVTLVDFWAPWCAPCRMLSPVVSELAEEFDGQAKIAKINVDDNKASAAKYGIRSIPTMIVFKDGLVVKQFTGIKPKSFISKIIKEQL
jgi:thioredoxin 1